MEVVKFIKSLTDSELKSFASAIAKEQRRRKKIAQANQRWIGNEGLTHVLSASLKQKHRDK